jgi:hypothetical protein
MHAPSIDDLRALGIPFVIRENRIADAKDLAEDRRGDKIALAMREDRAEAKKRHQDWKTLYAQGWTPQQIADKYQVYASTVRRVTGPSPNSRGRAKQRIRIGNVVYESQLDVLKKLKMGRQRLVKLLEIERARYVR